MNMGSTGDILQRATGPGFCMQSNSVNRELGTCFSGSQANPWERAIHETKTVTSYYVLVMVLVISLPFSPLN